MRELKDAPLAARTTIGVGGPARRLLELEDATELLAAAQSAARAGTPSFVLGGGSNLVLPDAGLQELVLHPHSERAPRFEQHQAETVLVQAEAGLAWDRLVEHAVEEGLAGIECLAGIPGQVGATPIQNVGAYGQQVSEVIEWVRAYDRHADRVETFSNADCAFGYRDSRFKRDTARRHVVLEVCFRLQRGAPAAPRYGELSRVLAAQGQTAPSVAQLRQSVLALRRSKSMVFDRDDPDSRSVGSFFVNPSVERKALLRIEQELRAAMGPTASVPHFPGEGDQVKLAAAWLIENAGFARGHQAGPVGLSSKHALAIINRGAATASDIRAFATTIQNAVADRFGIQLVPEAQLID